MVLPDGARRPTGRRIAKKVDGQLTRGFLWSGGALIAELDPQGNVVSRFVYGPESGAPDYMVKGQDVYRFIKDARGSPRLIIDADTGVAAQEMAFDPYGQVLVDSNPGFQPFGFAGGLYDPDTNLVEFGAREYSAETGRWTSPDPIGFQGGDTNLYAYAHGDPVNLTDRNGMIVPVVIAVAWAIVEIGLSMADAVSVAQTLLDECATDADKGAALAMFGLGLIAPGGGGSTALRHGDEAVEAASRVSRRGKLCVAGYCLFGACFTGDTPVETRDGLRSIDEVRAGDEVWSRHDETGAFSWQPVEKVKVQHGRQVIALDFVDDQGQTDTIEATPDHPFWVIGEGWVEAGELVEGDEVFTSSGGWMRLSGGTWLAGEHTVYNFEVAGTHTYFVGTSGAWVHNGGPGRCREAGDAIASVNGRRPINYRHSGSVFPAEELPASIRGKYPDGVPFNIQGFPDFSRHRIAKTKIELTGSRQKDFDLANEATGFDGTPEGFTWHHHQEAGVMELIPTDLHDAVKHTGGAAVSDLPY